MPSSTVPPENPPPTCVIVDDHAFIREGVRLRIEMGGHATVVGEAATGSAALDLLSNLRPDLCILDYRLPDMDGLSVLEIVRSIGIATRVVMLSAQLGPDHVRQALDIGASACVTKGSGRAIFDRAIAAAIGGTTYIDPAYGL